jgi:hypothetical protein
MAEAIVKSVEVGRAKGLWDIETGNAGGRGRAAGGRARRGNRVAAIDETTVADADVTGLATYPLGELVVIGGGEGAG